MSHWIYKNEIVTEIPDDVEGFIYIITNNVTGRKYIGRKYVKSTKRKPLTAKQKREGKVRRTRVTTESNWRTYTGSNKNMNSDIKELGKDKFTFEIITYARTKAQINYLEMFMQFITHSIIKNDYYNDTIGSNKFTTMILTGLHESICKIDEKYITNCLVI